MWLSTGKKFRYSNWTESQPDNYNNAEDCLEIGYEFLYWRTYNYLYWNDNVCSNARSFICEINK